MEAKRKPIKSIIKWIFYLAAATVLFFLLYAITIIANSPKIDPANLYSYLNETSIIYDDSGKKIDSVYLDGGNRSNMSYEDFPEDLVNAVVAVEDKTFWKHHGFNIVRMLGAIKDSLFSERQISGTSTITQQLARNVYLPETKDIRSINRKIQEAWYTVILEHKLTKKEIMEAYLNTIYMGNNSYGMASAANSYFSKDPNELNLLQCAALASIPKSPNYYALVKTIDNKTIEQEALALNKKDILRSGMDYTTVYNGDVSKDRRLMTLDLMKNQGYISAAERDAAKAQSLQRTINLNYLSAQGYTAYFTDFVADEVIEDLQEKGYSEKAAKKMLYSGGLRIYSTLDSSMQNKIASEFKKNSNYPSIEYSAVRFDKNRNIKTSDGQIMLYARKNYINKSKQFVLGKNEFREDEKGNLILKKGHRLSFIEAKTDGKTNYNIQFHPMYVIRKGIFYSIENSVLLVPRKYKALTANGDLIISSKFFKDYPHAAKKINGRYVFTKDGYTLAKKVRQPQGAMVVCDYRTGEVKAMIGGRGSSGKRLYNRANSPRQPGSSIKPLSVYSTALSDGEKASSEDKAQKFKKYDKNDNIYRYGSFWTAASMINDAPNIVDGKLWPKNVYNGYKGYVTLRKSVEQSINVNAVRVFRQLDKGDVISRLKDFGITTVVPQGSVNDNNASALALGGMSKGISPLEMASAYGTFPNEGRHISYTAYTKVENSKGDVVLENEPEEKQVMSDGVAYIMSDILRTTVRKGTAKEAAIPGQMVAGKTGTTSDQYDAWFCGFTPEYSASLWLGNDINLQLDEGSSAAVRMWKKVMTKVNNGQKGSMPSPPPSVIRYRGEYYINGTQRRLYDNSYRENTNKKSIDDPYSDDSNSTEKQQNGNNVIVVVCDNSGYAATPYCPYATEKVLDESAPQANYFCPVHNPDKSVYPTYQ